MASISRIHRPKDKLYSFLKKQKVKKFEDCQKMQFERLRLYCSQKITNVQFIYIALVSLQSKF